MQILCERHRSALEPGEKIPPATRRGIATRREREQFVERQRRRELERVRPGLRIETTTHFFGAHFIRIDPKRNRRVAHRQRLPRTRRRSPTTDDARFIDLS